MIPDNPVAAPGRRVRVAASLMMRAAILLVLFSVATESALGAELELRYYGAEWCAPCRRVEPMVDRWAAEHPDIRLVKLDYDANEADRLRFDFIGVPMLVLLAGDKLVGKYGQSAERVSDFGSNHLNRWYDFVTTKIGAPAQ